METEKTQNLPRTISAWTLKGRTETLILSNGMPYNEKIKRKTLDWSAGKEGSDTRSRPICKLPIEGKPLRT